MKARKYLENAATTAMLMESGIALMRQNIRRRHADASSEEVDALLRAWMCRASDPLPGDTAGNVKLREQCQ